MSLYISHIYNDKMVTLHAMGGIWKKITEVDEGQRINLNIPEKKWHFPKHQKLVKLLGAAN